MLADRSRRMTMSRAPPLTADATALWRTNGLANAATISAIAAARSSRRNQCRMRRRRTDWYGKLRRHGFDVRAHHRPVLVGQRFGNHGDLLAALEVLEARGVFVAEIDLRGIEHVKDDEIVSDELQRLDGFQDRLGLFVEVGDEHQNAAALEVLRHLVQWNREIARPLRPGPVERVHHPLEVLRPRR